MGILKTNKGSQKWEPFYFCERRMFNEKREKSQYNPCIKAGIIVL